MVLSSLKALLDGCWRCIVWFSFKLGAYCNLALLHPPNPYSTFLGTHTLISSSSPLICNHSGAPGQHHGLSWAILPLCSLPPNMVTLVGAFFTSTSYVVSAHSGFDLSLIYIVYGCQISRQYSWQSRVLCPPIWGPLFGPCLSVTEFCFRPKLILI